MLIALLSVSCGHADSRPPHSPPSNVIHSDPAPSSVGGLGLKGAMLGNSIDPSRVKGRLAPEVIQKIVRDNFGGMRACYEDGLRKNPKLTGKISTRFVIERDGRVSSASDIHDAPPPGELERQLQTRTEEPRFPDEAVVACVVAKFAALTFPQPKGGIVTVVYPIIFSPEEASP